MYTSYESLRIVHKQIVQEAQDRTQIQVELKEVRPQRFGLRTLLGLLRKTSSEPVKPYCAECS